MEKITLGRLRELTKDMDDKAIITFMYRENLFDDEGSDFVFTPTAIWFSSENSPEPEITLVSIEPPKEIPNEEECDCDGCECGEDCCEEDAGETLQ